MIDTLVVLLMLVRPVDTAQIRPRRPDRTELRETIQRTSDEAMQRALESTKERREEIYRSGSLVGVIEKQKHNNIKRNR